MKRLLAFLIVASLFFSVLIGQIGLNITQVDATPSTLKVPLDYQTIQAAINAASKSDTIFVYNGIYHENVVVNKTVSLVGEKKENTILDGNGIGPVIRVTAPDASVSGFTIQNATETGTRVGVYIANTRGVNITGNIIRNNWQGIALSNASSNTFKDNMVVSNTYGVYLSQSPQNFFDHNTALDNYYGFFISLAGSNGNTLRSNNMSQNSQNLKLILPLNLPDFAQDIDYSNTVDGKPIYYWMNQRDKLIPTDAGYVAIINSVNVTVRNVVTTKNGEGVLFVYTTNSTISNATASSNIGGSGIFLFSSSNNRILRSTVRNNLGTGIDLDMSNDNIILGNKVTNNSNGIVLGECTNNLIYGNTISNNTAQGIYTFNSENNTLHHNSFIDNAKHVSSELSFNLWDDGYPSGGNFWSNYTGPDDYYGKYQNIIGPDGIGDTPHIIDANNTDRYPLMHPPSTNQTFVISVSPLSQGVKPGQSVTFAVTIASENLFSPSVRFNDTTPNPISNNISFAFNPETVVLSVNGTVQCALTVNATSEATPATFLIVVNATSDGHNATDTVEVIILDIIRPSADAGPDQTVNEDALVTFDGSGSHDNVAIVDYIWTFVDGGRQTLTGANPAYVFTTPGNYLVTLNVTDAAGNWATDNVTITVLDVTKPVAKAGQDQTVQVGTQVTFDGSGSTDNVGIVKYEWNFGDGNNGTGVRVTHTYSNTGTFNVTLTVKDAADNSGTDSLIVSVTLPPANLQFLVLATVGGAVAVGVVVVLFFWRRRKQPSGKLTR